MRAPEKAASAGAATPAEARRRNLDIPTSSIHHTRMGGKPDRGKKRPGPPTPSSLAITADQILGESTAPHLAADIEADGSSDKGIRTEVRRTHTPGEGSLTMNEETMTYHDPARGEAAAEQSGTSPPRGRSITGKTRGKDHIDTDPLRPLAFTAQQITKLRIFPVSLRTWRRMDSSGACPRGFKVGGCKMWRTADLEQWVSEGFPNRSTFEAKLRALENGKGGHHAA